MAEVLEVLKYIGIGFLVIVFSVFCVVDYIKKTERTKHRHVQFGVVAQLARALDLHSRGRGFNSLQLHRERKITSSSFSARQKAPLVRSECVALALNARASCYGTFVNERRNATTPVLSRGSSQYLRKYLNWVRVLAFQARCCGFKSRLPLRGSYLC